METFRKSTNTTRAWRGRHFANGQRGTSWAGKDRPAGGREPQGHLSE